MALYRSLSCHIRLHEFTEVAMVNDDELINKSVYLLLQEGMIMLLVPWEVAEKGGGGGRRRRGVGWRCEERALAFSIWCRERRGLVQIKWRHGEGEREQRCRVWKFSEGLYICLRQWLEEGLKFITCEYGRVLSTLLEEVEKLYIISPRWIVQRDF